MTPAQRPRSKRALVLCLTPLHVLIAKRIAEKTGEQGDLGLFLTSSDNPKNRHYAQVMSEFCSHVQYMVVPGDNDYRSPRRLSLYLSRLRHRIKFGRLGHYGKAIVPASINQYVYVILSSVCPGEIVTFDDGLANVILDSPIGAATTSMQARFFLLAAGINFWPEKIRAKSARHYTLYRAENVYSRTEFIKLGDRMASTNSHNQEIEAACSLLLAPAPDVPTQVLAKIKQALESIKIDCYLPHPREVSPIFPDIKRISTPLIAEHYVQDWILKNPGARMNVYGFDTTALVHLAEYAEVESHTFMSMSAPASKIFHDAGVRFV